MIRPATTDDRLGILVLLDRCGLLHPDLTYDTWSHPTLVAEEDGQIVGMIQGLIGYPQSYIADVAVAPEYQKQGIGRKLYAAVEQVFKSAGSQAWCGLIDAENAEMIAAAPHLGAASVRGGAIFVKTLGDN